MENKSRDPLIYRAAYAFAILLLAINCIGAVYGGYALTTSPDGSSIGLYPALLRYTPFTSYFLPGVVLIILNGVVDFVVLLATIFKVQAFCRYVMLQGIVLLSWLVIQIILIRTFDKIHLVMASVGIFIVVCGWLLARQKSDRMAALSRTYNYYPISDDKHLSV